MLSIRDLVKVYAGNPPVTALYGVTLDIAPGMFGLLGPNGAGKSTLMRVLAGLLEATSGSVTFDAGDGGPPIDALKRPDRIWPVLGFLPQEFGFYPHLTGLQTLEFLLTLKGVESPGRSRRQLALELLERVNLTAAAKQRVRGYSGGMKQRLGIAQALAGDPKLIIVDEPTAGLDPEERHRFYRLLTELAQDRTVVLSTHIVEDVAVLCRRFAILKQGRLVADTTPADARAAMAGTVFEGEADMAELARLREQFCVTQAVLFEGMNRVRIYRPDRTPPTPGFSAAAPTLEDAYLAVMRGGATLGAAPLAGTAVPADAGPPAAAPPFDLTDDAPAPVATVPQPKADLP